MAALRLSGPAPPVVPLEPGGNVLGPNMADLGGAARGKEVGNAPFLSRDEVERAGGPVWLVWFRVCRCVLRLVKALSFSHSSPSSRSLKLD